MILAPSKYIYFLWITLCTMRMNYSFAFFTAVEKAVRTYFLFDMNFSHWCHKHHSKVYECFTWFYYVYEWQKVPWDWLSYFPFCSHLIEIGYRLFSVKCLNSFKKGPLGSILYVTKPFIVIICIGTLVALLKLKIYHHTPNMASFS